ncbi:MAG: extracellular solute-binding protein [Holosporales bacterium]|nr:extracellular solute-binding protein [Holosporales bacterium]
MVKKKWKGAGVLLGAASLIGALLWESQQSSPLPRTSRYGVSCAALQPLDASPVLHVYGWVNSFPPDVLADFEAITGIHVIFDVFDTNELLEAKLLAGNSGYDIVFPTAWPYFARELQGRVYQPLNKERLQPFWHLDEEILQRLENIDPGNCYAVPYLWGIMGIGLRTRKVKKVLGTLPHSWALVFDPYYAEKLKPLRIELCDAPGELIPAALAFIGKNPESDSMEDLKMAAAILRQVRPFITRFNPSGYESLASGTASIIVGTSGDISRAHRQVEREGQRNDVAFIFPKEGSSLWVDVMAIPKDALHVNNAHAFISYLLHPRVMAAITVFTMCANTVPSSQRYIAKEIRNNVLIYPTPSTRTRCYIERNMSTEYEAARTRVVTKIKSEH